MKREEDVWAPPILFNDPDKPTTSSHRKGKDDDDETVEDKSRYASFKVPFDPASKKADKETFERKLLIFEEGTPEEYIDLRKSIEALTQQLGYKKDSEIVNVARALLAGVSLQTFEEGYKRLQSENEEAGEDTHVSDAEIFERALNEVAKETFDNWEHAYAAEKRYLRSSLVMGFEQDPAKFCDRLENCCR